MLGNVPPTTETGKPLTLLGQTGRAFAMKAGTLVRAEVTELIGSGLVALKIVPQAGQAEALMGKVLTVKPDVPLVKGQHVMLQGVEGGKVRLVRVIGPTSGRSQSTQAEALEPAASARVPSAYTGAKLKSPEFRALAQMFGKTFPPTLKTQYPELKALGGLLITKSAGRPQAPALKQAVERSGVLFESRLGEAVTMVRHAGSAEKIAALLRPPTSAHAALEGKSTGALLGRALFDPGVISAFRSAGLQAGEFTVLLKVLGIRVSASETAMPELMQLQSEGNLGPLLAKLAAVIKAPQVVSAMRTAGVGQEDLSAVLNTLMSRTSLKGAALSALMKIVGRIVPEQVLAAGAEDMAGQEATAARGAATPKADAALLRALQAAGLTRGEAESLLKEAAEPAGRGLREGQRLMPEGDMKEALLRVKALMRRPDAVEALRNEGIRPQVVAEAVERLLNNIEFYQLNSKMNNALGTYFPLNWEGLRDGEFTFRHEDRDGGKACTCDIDLELESLGKLSISVTGFEGAFYVSFMHEEPGAGEILNGGRQELQENFQAQGLELKALNIRLRRGMSLGGEHAGDLDMRA